MCVSRVLVGVKFVRPRSLKKSALMLTDEGLRAIIVGSDTGEAEQISNCLANLNAGRILVFCHAANLIRSVPKGRLDLFVLAREYSPSSTNELLRWINRNWPRCQIAAIYNHSDTELEQIVRTNGGWFFIRPVFPEQWIAVLKGAGQIRFRV